MLYFSTFEPLRVIFPVVSMDWLDYLLDIVLKKLEGKKIPTFPPDIVLDEVICLNIMSN